MQQGHASNTALWALFLVRLSLMLRCLLVHDHLRFVSTTDQTTEHQRTQAEAAGFKIDRVVSDDGVSGVSTRLAERPEGRRLFDILRSGDTLVVRWVDRLGRNYSDVCDTIREFMRRGVVIRTVINGLLFDGATKDPMQQAVRDALIAFMAATAQANAEAVKEAQRSGIALASRMILRPARTLPSSPSCAIYGISRRKISLSTTRIFRPTFSVSASDQRRSFGLSTANTAGRALTA
jgi:DNA invertase Pin-like site-specific DNA recombinase